MSDGERPIGWISKDDGEAVVLVVEEDRAGFEIRDETSHLGDGGGHGEGRWRWRGRRRIVSVGRGGRVGRLTRREVVVAVIVVVVVDSRRRVVDC